MEINDFWCVKSQFKFYICRTLTFIGCCIETPSPEKSNWIRELSNQSWNLELVVLGAAIYSTSFLPELTDVPPKKKGKGIKMAWGLCSALALLGKNNRSGTKFLGYFGLSVNKLSELGEIDSINGNSHSFPLVNQ